MIIAAACLACMALPACATAAPGDANEPAGARLVSITAQDADLRGVLRALAEQARLDLIIDPDVNGTVTLAVENVPLRPALEAVLAPGEFSFELEDDVLRVTGKSLQTRIFTLDYMTSVRTGLTRLSASSGGSGGEEQTTQSGGDGRSGGQSQFSVDSQMSSDPWAEIIRSLELIVFGDIGGGSADRPERLVIHPASGVVLVRATLPTLNRVATFLEGIAGAVHRQVMIDVQIIEVTLDEGLEMGIDWSQIPGGGDVVTSVFGKDKVAAAQNLSPHNKVFEIAGSSDDFDALLDALETQGSLKVVSAPTVATLNNQKAIVKVAREQSFFNQRIDYQTLPDGAAEPIFSVEPQRITIGLILDVTPQIAANADVMMHVHPSLTELIGEDVFPPGASGPDIQANAPILDIREVDTVVEIRNGNMLVIGGLVKDKVDRKEKRVPLLGRIPILGYLFKQVIYEKRQVELVIVLRPTVVVGEEADAAAMQEMERLKGMGEM